MHAQISSIHYTNHGDTKGNHFSCIDVNIDNIVYQIQIDKGWHKIILVEAKKCFPV